MPSRRHTLLLFASLLLPPLTHAHQVPSLTIEANFTPEGQLTLTINLDPRLFLAEDPTTLPPIAAPWFRDQSPEAKTQTLADALTYVQSALTFFFNDQPAANLIWQFEPIDGATNGPFTDTTAEVHFLATCKTQRPATATTSTVRLEPKAKAAAVLLNSLNQQTERRPQILFPGETSRPFLLTPQKS
jgi:hypothetical protein